MAMKPLTRDSNPRISASCGPTTQPPIPPIWGLRIRVHGVLLEPPPRTTCNSLSKPLSTQSRTCGSQTDLRPATERIYATDSAEEDQIGGENLKSFASRLGASTSGQAEDPMTHIKSPQHGKVYHARTTSTNTVFTQLKKIKKLLCPSRTGKRPPSFA